jgi:hypothetical protein
VDKAFEKSVLVKPISPFSDTSDYPSGEILNNSRYVFLLCLALLKYGFTLSTTSSNQKNDFFVQKFS